MQVREKKQRVNIMLDETQRVFIDQLAEERNTSVSEVIREMIQEKKKKEQMEKLAKAADALAEEYSINDELTGFTVLDGEEIE